MNSDWIRRITIVRDTSYSTIFSACSQLKFHNNLISYIPPVGSSSIYAMDQGTHLPPSGLKQLNLKKSFKLGIRSLLTACSKEEFCKAFSTFDKKKQEALHQLFIQVITCLHENIEEEFESLCHETKVITTLDTVEQLVEEQTLDLLSQKKSNLLDVKQSMTSAKKDEISYLTTMLEKAVEQNHQMRTQIESLKKNSQDLSTTTDAVGKLRSWNVNYGQTS